MSGLNIFQRDQFQKLVLKGFFLIQVESRTGSAKGQSRCSR